jgi:hypothetical protein
MPMPPAISQIQHSAKIVKEFMKRVKRPPLSPIQLQKVSEGIKEKRRFCEHISPLLALSLADLLDNLGASA